MQFYMSTLTLSIMTFRSFGIMKMHDNKVGTLRVIALNLTHFYRVSSY
jgi:hypothetical protein